MIIISIVKMQKKKTNVFVAHKNIFNLSTVSQKKLDKQNP
jgi:hypothetical protein